MATLRLDRCRVWEHIEQIPLSRLRESMLLAEALGNPRNYPLDERVFAAFGYLSDFLRVGALRFARWCADMTAPPPRAYFCPTELCKFHIPHFLPRLPEPLRHRRAHQIGAIESGNEDSEPLNFGYERNRSYRASANTGTEKAVSTQLMGAQAVQRHVGLLLFVTFSFKQRKSLSSLTEFCGNSE